MKVRQEFLREVIKKFDNAEDAINFAYRQGYKDGIMNYAIWKDGEQRIGAMNRTVTEVLTDLQNSEIPLRY